MAIINNNRIKGGWSMIQIKQEKAVTLTAVIIAIILILILAAVTVQFLIGPEGIIEKAKQGTSAYKEQSIRERLTLKLADWSIELLEQGEGESKIDTIIALAEKDSEVQNVTQNLNNIVFVMDEYQCEIDTDLNIVSIQVYDPQTTLKRAPRMLEFCTIER